MAPGNISGHKVRLQYLFPVLVKKHVLGCQIDLRIGIAIVRAVMACSCLGIDRFPCCIFPCLQYLCQLLQFSFLVDPPAIKPGHLHGFPIAGLKGAFFVGCVVSERQILYVF